MRIRPYAAGEELALLAIFQSSVRGIASRNYTPDQIEAWAPSDVTDEYRKQWVDRIRSNQPWVAEVDGDLAAFADLQPSGYIDQFFVAAEFAGQGIGAALMRHLQELALSRGITSLFAHVSLTAQPFFRSFGFDLEKEQRPVIRGILLRNAVMSKQLTAIGKEQE
jgi:putative acetyltransferase